MSIAAMARPMSTRLYLFSFIVRLCLLRQPQRGLWANDSNPAGANSVNGLLCNEMSFEHPAKTISAGIRLKSAAE